MSCMDDLTYWTEKLRQAEQELEAAKKRSDVDAAARKLQYAKARLKAALEESTAGRPRRGKQPR